MTSFTTIFNSKFHMWLQIPLVTFDKLHKILVAKDIM
jgi:hypothetical protein